MSSLWFNSTSRGARLFWNARLLPRLLLVVCLTAMCGGATLTASSSNAPLEVQTVIDGYYAALKTGDVSTLQTILGGSLLAKRQGLLRNPTYPDHLMETYKTCAKQIRRYATEDSGDVVVDVDQWLNPQELIRMRFVLHRSTDDGVLRIVGESIVP
jgi:hypothetical protein